MLAGKLVSYSGSEVVPEDQASKSLRVGFRVQDDDGDIQDVSAVHCIDLYKDYYEAELSEKAR